MAQYTETTASSLVSATDKSFLTLDQKKVIFGAVTMINMQSEGHTPLSSDHYTYNLLKRALMDNVYTQEDLRKWFSDVESYDVIDRHNSTWWQCLNILIGRNVGDKNGSVIIKKEVKSFPIPVMRDDTIHIPPEDKPAMLILKESTMTTEYADDLKWVHSQKCPTIIRAFCCALDNVIFEVNRFKTAGYNRLILAQLNKLPSDTSHLWYNDDGKTHCTYEQIHAAIKEIMPLEIIFI
jgi:hypothetical protein